MTFKERLKELITRLETEEALKNDSALHNIIKILKTVECVNDLKRQKRLINRITIDSLDNMEIGEYILTFTDIYTKTNEN